MDGPDEFAFFSLAAYPPPTDDVKDYSENAVTEAKILAPPYNMLDGPLFFLLVSNSTYFLIILA
jgi:hypothetical protein